MTLGSILCRHVVGRRRVLAMVEQSPAPMPTKDHFPSLSVSQEGNVGLRAFRIESQTPRARCVPALGARPPLRLDHLDHRSKAIELCKESNPCPR